MRTKAPAHKFVAPVLLAIGLIGISGTVALAAPEGAALCKEDVARLCPGVQPGGGRIIGCLKEHKMEVSVGCAKTLQALKAKMGK